MLVAILLKNGDVVHYDSDETPIKFALSTPEREAVIKLHEDLKKARAGAFATNTSWDVTKRVDLSSPDKCVIAQQKLTDGMMRFGQKVYAYANSGLENAASGTVVTPS